MSFLRKHPKEPISQRIFVSARISSSWIYGVTGAVLILNFLMLLYYQHYIAGDFPFQDEWGYVHRLQELQNTGFLRYLFDRYQTYYIPIFFFVWYLFYALAHLDFMAIRYAGAVISFLVSLLLCVMLYRKKRQPNPLIWLIILCGPFIVCSYVHWATYNQSIESVAEFLLFGFVLASCWAAEGTLQSQSTDLWAVLCVIGGLLASGTYAPGLSLLPAIVASRFLIRPRIDWPLIVMAVPAVLVPVMYVTAGAGFGHGHHIALPALSLTDIWKIFEMWVGLTGNALLIPGLVYIRNLTRALGFGILIIQCVGIVHVLRLPVERRVRFMVPIILTFYNTLVFIEILAARFNFPDVAFTPRYSIHMIGGPVSVLFWMVTLSDSIHWRRGFKVFAALVVLMGIGASVTLANAEGIWLLPGFRHTLSGIRADLMSLHSEPNPFQQRDMYISPALLPFVYPGRIFLEANGLAMYRQATEAEKAAAQLNENEDIQIVKYGPQNIRANIGFHIQSNGMSAMWIRMSQVLEGNVKIYIFINGTRLPGVHRGDLVTVEVPTTLYSKPGSYPMYVLELRDHQEIKSKSVDFVVH